MVIHGSGGCGKSTFASHAPNPIFVAAEDGLVSLDAKAFPEPKDWEGLLEQVETLATGVHDYGTLVIDSIDWVEPLCWAHVCKKAKKADIEAFGYGKGYVAALAEWRILLHRLSAVRARGMHVILIAHSVRKPIRNPEGDDYDSWQIKLNEKASGLIKEWVDIIGFASHEVVTEDTSGRAKGIATGQRILRVQPAAGYEAKTRYALPPKLPLTWDGFANAMKKSVEGDAK